MNNPSTKPIRKYGAIRVVLTTLLCIALFILITAASLVKMLQDTISEQTIHDTIVSIDAETLIDEFEILPILLDELDDEHVEIFEELQPLIMDILDSELVKGFTAEMVAGYIDAVISGEEEFRISHEDIMRFIREGATIVETETGYQVSETDIEFIDEIIRQSNVVEDYAIIPIPEDIAESMEVLHIPRDPATFTTLLVLCLVTLVAIVLVNLKHIHAALQGSGISSLCAGLAHITFGMLMQSLVETILGSTINITLIEHLLVKIRNTLTTNGMILAIAGIVLIITSIIIKSKKPNPS